MAVSNSIRLTERERFWYLTRVTGATAQTPFGEVKKRYWLSQVGSGYSSKNSMFELEKAWLRKVIVDNGGTISGQRISELYRTAVATLTYPVSPRLEENKFTLFGRYNP